LRSNGTSQGWSVADRSGSTAASGDLGATPSAPLVTDFGDQRCDQRARLNLFLSPTAYACQSRAGVIPGAATGNSAGRQDDFRRSIKQRNRLAALKLGSVAQTVGTPIADLERAAKRPNSTPFLREETRAIATVHPGWACRRRYSHSHG